MNYINWNTQPFRIVAATADGEFTRWRNEVEHYAVALGCRSLLEHVDPATWVASYLSGEDAEDAVLAELAKVAE